MRARIDAARASDLAALAGLTRQALPTPWSEADLARELARPEARILVAREGAPDPATAAPVGYLLAHRIVDELHLLLLAVEPASRRRGIASALVARALGEARATGARVALLEVRAGNEPARALYQRLGFSAVGVRRRYYADGEDAVLLTLELDAADAAR